MAVSTDNPVVGAFQLMWDNWINVLNFLSKGSVTIDSAVVVTLVMIVVGVLVYVMLKNIVFAKLSEAIKGGGGFGGGALSNWVPFLITISIVLLMVYTGVILLLIPWLWVLFIAMIIGIGWMLWGGTKAFITSGMELGKQFSIGEKWAERRELGRERQLAAMEKEEEFAKRELAAEERLEEAEG